MNETKKLVQGFAQDYVRTRLVEYMRCPKCKRPLLISEAQYPYQCVCCDEDFFNFECLMVNTPVPDGEIKFLEKHAKQRFEPTFNNAHCSSAEELAAFIIDCAECVSSAVKQDDDKVENMTFSTGFIDGLRRFDDYVVSRQSAFETCTFDKALFELNRMLSREEKTLTIIDYGVGYIEGLKNAVQQLVNVYQCSATKKFSHFLSRYLMARKEILEERIPILLQILFTSEDPGAPYYQVLTAVYGTEDDMRQIADSFASYIDSVKNVEDLDYDECVEEVLNASHLKWERLNNSPLKWEKSSALPSTKSIYTIWV